MEFSDQHVMQLLDQHQQSLADVLLDMFRNSAADKRSLILAMYEASQHFSAIDFAATTTSVAYSKLLSHPEELIFRQFVEYQVDWSQIEARAFLQQLVSHYHANGHVNGHAGSDELSLSSAL